LDGRLKREERKRAQIRTKDFGLEVRNIFHNPLSLRNMIQITSISREWRKNRSVPFR
jgi:hypothetical protein